MSEADRSNLIELTADIVSAYVQKNPVPVSGLPDLIASVNLALAAVGQPIAPVEPVLKPAVSLEDGKKYKSLKRHLAATYGLSPDEYRAKWGLTKDYPMVAPNYSATRSALAKSLGLGRKPVAPPKRANKARKGKA